MKKGSSDFTTGAHAGPTRVDREQAESGAAMWIARVDAGLSAVEREAFAQWLAADPRNAEAWRELRGAWEAFDRPAQAGIAMAMVHELAGRRRRRWWRTAWSVGTFASAAAAVWLLALRPASVDVTTTGATRLVLMEPERRDLPDQSIVKLNEEAAIDVKYEPDERHVSLLAGEAHFAVAKNPARPFVVSAGGVSVRAVGTAFSVKIGPDDVEVLVSEGVVAVTRTESEPEARSAAAVFANRDAEPVLVSAGGLVEVPTSAKGSAEGLPVRSLTRIEVERRLEWLAPRLELAGTPLAEVVDMFNRNTGAHLSIAEASLGSVRMSGVIRADNVDGFIRLLESGYGIVAERTAAGDVVLRTAR